MDNLRRSSAQSVPPRQTSPLESAAPEPQASPSVGRPASSASKGRVSRPGKNKLLGILLAIVAVLSLVGIGWYTFQATSTSLVDSSKFQAVFLTNGQVYFGKLQTAGDYYKLTKIFYLQASDTADDNNPQNTAGEEGGNDVQLIKLGTEIHGPTDEMIIARDQVLFYENLKDDGNVVQSINQYFEANK